MATPLIKTLQSQGGTFYGFSSAGRDLTRAAFNENLKFEFSKFALGKLPDVRVPTHKENYLQFRTIDGAIFNGLNGDDNVNLAESLQNYALNIETIILNDDDYDDTLLASVSERVFFKWLKEIGGIRYREANTTNEKNPAVTDARYVEEDTVSVGSQRYENVIKYISEIDVVNSVNKNGQTYTEVYINVPTRVGGTPKILFKTLEDANYYGSQIITEGNEENISGRGDSTIHPSGNSFKAFYDYDAAVSYTDADANWHGSTVTDAYFTDPAFDDPSSTEITKTQTDYSGVDAFSDINYLRSNLDGVTIDWEANDYIGIVNDANITTIQEFNSSLSAVNEFEFNFILVYYDLYDKSTPEDRATNLYGVIFLDNITPDATGGLIAPSKKIKPNSITGLNGNAYGLKMNFKFDQSIDNASVELIVNDYNQFGMDLFIDASVQLQEAARTLLNTQVQFEDVVNRVNDLENLVFTSENVTELRSRVNTLESQITAANLALADSETILDLIGQNSDRIQEIFAGNLPATVTFNTEVFKSGDGVTVDKSVPNKIKFQNTNQQYAINEMYEESTFSTLINSGNPLNLNQNVINAYVKLEKFTNLFRVNVSNDALSNVRIRIDDLGNRFKEGQSIKFAFDTELSLNSKSIIFFTDKENRFEFGELSYQMGSISASDLITNKPIIEITCLDEVNYTFAIDILR